LQVFTVFMHLQDAAERKVSCNTTASRKKTSVAGLKHFTEAVEALTQSELSELSMPTLRSVQILEIVLLMHKLQNLNDGWLSSSR